MKEIDLKQIKSMEELKKELGDKYDEVMYKMNLELFDRMDRATEYIESYINQFNGVYPTADMRYLDLHKLLNILKGEK